MIIAGVGSRETPLDVLVTMIEIGKWCKDHNIWVHSGHAEGADWAFERGAQEKCIAYLPWLGFNSHLVSKAQLKIPKDNSEATILAEQYHPAYDKLSRGGKALMVRNGYQVLGESLSSPVDAVVCWTTRGQATGGTGQVIRIATAKSIPIYNLYSMDKEIIFQKLEFQNSARKDKT
jgi:hypothetical protein